MTKAPGRTAYEAYTLQARDRIHALEAELTTAKQLADDYRQGAAAEAQRCDELLAERNRARNETIAAQERVSDLSHQLGKAQGEAEGLAMQFGSLRAELQAKLTKADENLSALSKRHDAQVQVATEERAELREQLAKLEADIHVSVARDLDAYNAVCTERDSLKSENEKLREDLDNTMRELAHARTPDGVKTALLDLDKDPNVGGPIGAVTKSWRQLYDKAADCVVELRQASSERDELRGKLTASEREVAALKQSLKAADACLKEEQRANREHAEARRQLTARLSEAEKANAELRAQLDQVCGVLYNTGATRGDALTRAKRANETYHELINEQVSLEEERDALKAENEKLRVERDGLLTAGGMLHDQLMLWHGSDDWEPGDEAAASAWLAAIRIPKQKQSPTSDSPATAAQAPLRRRDCPHCGPGCRFDEDGCCATCGADTFVVATDRPAKPKCSKCGR